MVESAAEDVQKGSQQALGERWGCWSAVLDGAWQGPALLVYCLAAVSRARNVWCGISVACVRLVPLLVYRDALTLSLPLLHPPPTTCVSHSLPARLAALHALRRPTGRPRLALQQLYHTPSLQMTSSMS